MNTSNSSPSPATPVAKPRRKRFGYIMAGPADFAIHRRAGRTRKVGRGISFIALPVIDRYYLIPSTAQSVSFAADQITAENQGVEVAGFAVWKITQPETAAAAFNFSDSTKAVETIGGNIRNVVESAIRHQVANMTIEDVLRKRGTIILALKEELAYIAGQWGLEIETVEIRTVRVMSEQLFAQMQARFRDAMRLESETSALDTEKRLAELQFAQKEALALKEREFEKNELERSTEAARSRAAAETKLEAFRQDQRRVLVASEQLAHEAQAALDIARGKHQAALFLMTDETRKVQIATANAEDPVLAFMKQLPAALGAMKVNELNIGEDVLRALARGLNVAFRGRESHGSALPAL